MKSLFKKSAFIDDVDNFPKIFHSNYANIP